MIIQIKKYKYEKVEIESKDFELPTLPSYFFETGIRRSIKIVPIYNTKNEIYQFEIICIYLSFECIIEKFRIAVEALKDLNNISNKKHRDFVDAWLSDFFDKRTEQRFNEDLMNALQQIAPEKLK